MTILHTRKWYVRFVQTDFCSIVNQGRQHVENKQSFRTQAFTE